MKSEDSWLTIHGFARLRFHKPFVVTFAPRKNDDVNPISASASTSSTPRPLSGLLEKKCHTKASLSSSSSSLFFCNVEKKKGTSSYIGYVSEQEKQHTKNGAKPFDCKQKKNPSSSRMSCRLSIIPTVTQTNRQTDRQRQRQRGWNEGHWVMAARYEGTELHKSIQKLGIQLQTPCIQIPKLDHDKARV